MARKDKRGSGFRDIGLGFRVWGLGKKGLKGCRCAEPTGAKEDGHMLTGRFAGAVLRIHACCQGTLTSILLSTCGRVSKLLIPLWGFQAGVWEHMG